jgi:hypothetical protein
MPPPGIRATNLAAEALLPVSSGSVRGRNPSPMPSRAAGRPVEPFRGLRAPFALLDQTARPGAPGGCCGGVPPNRSRPGDPGPGPGGAPHLVKVFTPGFGGDQWFYAMELVGGAGLAAVCGQLAGSTASGLSAEEWTQAVNAARERQRRTRSRTCRLGRHSRCSPRGSRAVLGGLQQLGYAEKARAVRGAACGGPLAPLALGTPLRRSTQSRTTVGTPQRCQLGRGVVARCGGRPWGSTHQHTQRR